MRKTGLRYILRTMMLSLSLLLPLGLSAQRVSLELKNATVQEAVTQLQSQGNYTIVINSDDVDLGRKINVSAKDAPLSEVVAQIFAGQDLDFEINGNTVSVVRRKAQPAAAAGKSGFKPCGAQLSGRRYGLLPRLQ